MMAHKLMLPIGLVLALSCAVGAQEQAREPSVAEASPAAPGAAPNSQELDVLATPPAALHAPLVYPSESGPMDLRYRSFADAAAGLPATCTSCVDSTPAGCGSNGFIARSWRNRWKPFLQETHWGYCEYFDEPPFGSVTRKAIATQLAASWRAQLVLYQFDFLPVDGEHPQELSARGRRELLRVAQKFMIMPAPIVIEQSPGNPTLDAQRREHVLQELQRIGANVADEHVIVGPAPSGLMGVEAVQVFDRFLEQSGQSGQGVGASRNMRPTAAVGAGGMSLPLR
ncbi:MAG TPA: hypothetical protein PLF81_17335 [Candidatus Anammoximicrobium sp.]|nr:hypothetical protein [Candidatus Anammoximicrobium sp.]